MGCGASKGKDEAQADITEIAFKPVGVQSMDDFFDKCSEVTTSFKDITGPLGEQKDAFYEVTGFYAVPGAGIYISDNLYRGKARFYWHVYFSHCIGQGK